MLTAVAAAWTVGGSPVSAESEDCPGWVDRNGNCHLDVEVPIDQPGTTGGGSNDPATPTTLDPNRCEWYTYPDQARWRTVFPEAPEDAVFGEEHCYVDGNAVYGPYVPQWVVPGEAAATVTPEQAARTLWARLDDTLLVPDPVTSPPAGTSSVVGVPTFFAVDNWQGEQSVSDCVGTVCVTLTATPRLSVTHGEPATPSLGIASGEPGTGTFNCAGGGTRFDPDADESARAQANVPGACAHIYRQRTGVDHRPASWTAVMHVTWEVSWSGAGQSGSFDPFTLDSPPIPIPVSDISSVVVESG